MEQLPYFNKITLGEILGKSGENLNYWIKTRLKNGEIIQLKKGLYVSKLYLFSQERNIGNKEQYCELLANIIRYPSYISLEYALSKYGLIPEAIFAYTSVGLKSSRRFTNKLGNFYYRNIKKALFFGFKTIDFEGKRIKFATKAKALFDFLYFKKFISLSHLKAELFVDLRINWDEFENVDKQEFKSIVLKSGSSKMKSVLKILKW